MSRRLRSLWIGGLLLAFFVLRDDFWLADEPARVLGLPAGLAYHAAYCIAAAVLMALLVRVAWPLRDDAPDAEDRP